jgi:hypothetical protein
VIFSFPAGGTEGRKSQSHSAIFGCVVAAPIAATSRRINTVRAGLKLAEGGGDEIVPKTGLEEDGIRRVGFHQSRIISLRTKV